VGYAVEKGRAGDRRFAAHKTGWEKEKEKIRKTRIFMACEDSKRAKRGRRSASYRLKESIQPNPTQKKKTPQKNTKNKKTPPPPTAKKNQNEHSDTTESNREKVGTKKRTVERTTRLARPVAVQLIGAGNTLIGKTPCYGTVEWKPGKPIPLKRARETGGDNRGEAILSRWFQL